MQSIFLLNLTGFAMALELPNIKMLTKFDFKYCFYRLVITKLSYFWFYSQILRFTCKSKSVVTVGQYIFIVSEKTAMLTLNKKRKIVKGKIKSNKPSISLAAHRSISVNTAVGYYSVRRGRRLIAFHRIYPECCFGLDGPH